MATWKQAGEYLVRHSAGTYYLRARVGGKVIRRSLGTKSLRIAKLKRDAALDAMRKAAARTGDEESKARTIGQAIELLERDIEKRPHIKPATVENYRKRIAILRMTVPMKMAGRTWTASAASDWWHKLASKYAPQTCNQALRLLRHAIAILIQNGAMIDDPTKALKNIPITQKARNMPSRETIEEVIRSIRIQGKRASEESANFVAFLAYSGCRKGEVSAATWDDIGTDWLTVHGGKGGTKNRTVRMVPINPSLRRLLESMVRKSGPIFSIKTPRIALDNACERLGIDHLRIHDLRHWFGTWAIEKGIEIPTVAKWLGHKDGGSLLMKTYGHLRDAHSLESAKRLE